MIEGRRIICLYADLPTSWRASRANPCIFGIHCQSTGMAHTSRCYNSPGVKPLSVISLRRTDFESEGNERPAMTTFGPFGDTLRPALCMVHSGELLQLTTCTAARCVGHGGRTNALEFEAARAGISSSLLNGKATHPDPPSITTTTPEINRISAA